MALTSNGLRWGMAASHARRGLTLLLAGTVALTAAAQDVAVTTLAPVQVLAEGVQFGPGVWTIDNGRHRLLLLGTQSPLPRRMRWHAEPVVVQIAASQALLEPPAPEFNLRWWQGLALTPAALRARRNPDGGRLAEAITPTLYTRWQALRARYLPRGDQVEQFRPLFAAQRLYERAVERVGLERAERVEKLIRRTASRHRLQRIRPRVALRIDSPRQVLRAFAGEHLDDGACFAATLDRLETDLGAMQLRANAWAIGDLEALAALPEPNHLGACADAVLNAQALAGAGFEGLRARLAQAWLDAAEAALTEHRQTFAYLPMAIILGENGALAQLRARGYRIQAPE